MQAVTADTVRLVLDSVTVARLPDGAVFTARKGRSHVNLSRGKSEDGKPTLIVEAGCDSLQRLVESYERQVQAMEAQMRTSQAISETASERRSNPIKTMIETFLVGLAVGIVITLLFKKLWNIMF
ncbi:MAG TPA: hypothetical protein PLJ83_06875 [Spirochaetales bacterium]|nr:hypothetical protein [Spirochaetales bacterium]